MRVLCLFLAFLMVAGMATLGITLLINEAFAANVSYNESDYAFSSLTDGDTYIAVGLMYGSSITVGFEVKAPYGFVVGSTVITEDERSFDPFYYLDTNIASATVDSNLYKKSMTYYLTDDPGATVIGGYHLELTNKNYGEMPLEFLVDDVENCIGNEPLYPIPCNIKGENKIRLGAYATAQDAKSAAASYSSLFPDYDVSIAYPSQTAVSIVNPEIDRILFEFDSGNASNSIGLMAYQSDEHTSYIQTPADNLYDGVFAFIPRYTDTATGVQLVNMLDLESYVEGVLPYEISNSWSAEVLRTFAITIRSYAIANYCKWFNSYGFDMTSTTSDQVYRGRNRVNNAVVEAVTSTEGIVTTYDGKVVSAYYSSSVGGSTIGSQYVWGSPRGYLTTVQTPWEKYADYKNGIWHSEVSPTELCNTLRTKGYTNLSGAIASIQVETVESNPDYIYSLTFTDTRGNTATVKRSDTVRTVLSSYLKSANFTVGKGSLNHTYNKVHDIKILGREGVVTPPDNNDTEKFYTIGYITENPILASEMQILTENGELVTSEYPVAYVLTSTGRMIQYNSVIATANDYDDVVPFVYDNNKVTIRDRGSLADGDEDFSSTEDFGEAEGVALDEYASETVTRTTSIGNNAYEVTSNFGNITVVTTLETVTETITASSSDNFIFAGKGWGHGVGISQYGAKDLSDAGATAEEIISIYFNDVQLVHVDTLVSQ